MESPGEGHNYSGNMDEARVCTKLDCFANSKLHTHPSSYTHIRCTQHTQHTRTEEERANLALLGLDRPTLEKQSVAPHHINRLYHLLHSSAMGFALTVAAEQRRLAGLLSTKVCVYLESWPEPRMYDIQTF